MKKSWIGFDRHLEIPWLDEMAAKVLEGKNQKEIRKEMYEYLCLKMKGKEAASKTVTVLMRLWFPEDGDKNLIIERANSLLTKVLPIERIWIYWGLIIIRYPFVRDLADITGRLLDLQGIASIAEIRKRTVEHWGDRITVKRWVQMFTKTMENFNFIRATGSRQSLAFESQGKQSTKNTTLLQWFIEVVIRSLSSDMLPLEEIAHQYSIFPFEIDIRILELCDNDRFEIRREGFDKTLVGVK